MWWWTGNFGATHTHQNIASIYNLGYICLKLAQTQPSRACRDRRTASPHIAKYSHIRHQLRCNQPCRLALVEFARKPCTRQTHTHTTPHPWFLRRRHRHHQHHHLDTNKNNLCMLELNCISRAHFAIGAIAHNTSCVYFGGGDDSDDDGGGGAHSPSVKRERARALCRHASPYICARET